MTTAVTQYKTLNMQIQGTVELQRYNGNLIHTNPLPL